MTIQSPTTPSILVLHASDARSTTWHSYHVPCERTSHLERVGHRKKEETSSTNCTTIISKSECFSQVKQSFNLSTFRLQVNRHDFTFEVSTGTFNSFIFMESWHRFHSSSIRPYKIKFKCYNGYSLKLKGQCCVNVEHEKQVFSLLIIPLHGSNSTLSSIYEIHDGFTSQLLQTTTGSQLFKYRQMAKFHVGQLVWIIKPHRNQWSQYQSAIFINHYGTMIYEIQLSDEQHVKCHQNQIRLSLRHCSNDHSSYIDSLHDDLLNKKSQFNTTQRRSYSSSSIESFRINGLLDTNGNYLPIEVSSHFTSNNSCLSSSESQSSRYPRRDRRAPDRYSP
jgi:hypothetical protein